VSERKPVVQELRVSPHEPFMGRRERVAWQVALAPPFIPSQTHDEEPPFGGLEGMLGFGVPVAQYVPEGNVSVAE